MSRVDMVQSQSKQNKKVTTLLTMDMVKAIDVLNAKRGICGIKTNNKYLFSNWEEGHLDSWSTLQLTARNAGCINFNLITSNSLRKYISTVCQVMDLTEGETEWLFNHLAHTVKTHNAFNKLQEATVEIAKVSKLLLATENGDISKYKGKSINDINLEEMDMPMDAIDDENNGAEFMEGEINSDGELGEVGVFPKRYDKGDACNNAILKKTSQHEFIKAKDQIPTDKSDIDDSDEDEIIPRKKRRTVTITSDTSGNEEFNCNYIPEKKEICGSEKNPVMKKQRWSQKEKEIFSKKFSIYLKEKKNAIEVVFRTLHTNA